MKAAFKNGCYAGNIYHAYSEKNDAIITISSAEYSGAITTTTSSHPKGSPKCKEEYGLIGRVEHVPCPKDTEFGLKVLLENGAVWKVTAPSYLTDLTIAEGCIVEGTLTVNGVETAPVPGTYSGKLVLKP